MRGAALMIERISKVVEAHKGFFCCSILFICILKNIHCFYCEINLKIKLGKGYCVVISDANFRRYGIRASQLNQLIVNASDKKVDLHFVFMSSIKCCATVMFVEKLINCRIHWGRFCWNQLKNEQLVRCHQQIIKSWILKTIFWINFQINI